MSIVVMGIRVPTPDLDSGSLRMTRILTLLRELAETVYFVPCSPFQQEPYGSRLEEDMAGLSRLGVHVLPTPENPDAVAPLLPRDARTVILSDEWVAARFMSTVKNALPEATVVFDTVDLHHIRLYREAKITRNRKLAVMAVQAQQRELAAAVQADVTLVVSGEEARVLHTTIPGGDIRVLSNIHPVVDRPEPSFDQRSGLLFVGSFDHSPNRDAVRHLLGTLLPLIRAQLPDVHVSIAGANPPRDLVSHAPAGIAFRDFVPDLIPLYDRARVSVAPLRFGAGVKGKVLDSMAHGLPVAGTSIAAEGLNAADGRHMVIADNDADFADKLARLHLDPTLWQVVRNNGRQLVRQEFSWERARRVVQSLVSRRGI